MACLPSGPCLTEVWRKSQACCVVGLPTATDYMEATPSSTLILADERVDEWKCEEIQALFL